MPERKELQRLGLFVKEEKDREYYHVIGCPVLILPGDKIRNPGDQIVNGLYLNHLQAYSQGDERTKKERPNDALYAWQLHYKPYSVELDDARHMVKTLETIGKRMRKLDETVGRPETFGHYLGRLAAAIKADSFVWSRGHARNSAWGGYDDDVHTIAPVKDGIYNVNYWIQKWVNPEPEAA